MSERESTPQPSRQRETRSYVNPVYAGYLGDPFVWRVMGEYYAVGTGPLEADGQVEEAKTATGAFDAQLRLFPLLRSDDFVTWRAVSGALLPPDPTLGNTFWAPEVAYHDSRYYLYYSVGVADKRHHLRVAVSDHPLGPYKDTGVPLIDLDANPFTIDPHPFQDEDGQWFLFYATDFLDLSGEQRAGTALAVDRLVTMTRLAGEPHTVLRARSDWQRFQSERLMYGQTWDWHTLEGPCVRKHAGRYYCFYSGGRWDSERYGVDYGVADSPLGPYSDAGNEEGPRVLRSVPGHVLGPGHNSLVVGPDDETEYLVYHAWDTGLNERTMRFDRLLWTPDGPRCDGPTFTPQTVNALRSSQASL